MNPFRKTLWTSILFIALLAPFVVVLALTLHTHISPERIQAAQQSAAAEEANAARRLIVTPPSTTSGDVSTEAVLLAASDGKTLWVVHPLEGDEAGKGGHSYELLQRLGNSGMWVQAQSERGASFSGFPRELAAVGSGASRYKAADAFVFTDGSVTRFGLSQHALEDALPAGQILLAATGGTNEAFALTAGARVSAMSGRATVDVPDPGALAEETAATMRARSMPATAVATQVASKTYRNVYWFHDQQWFDLPAMGEGDGTEGNLVPGKGATSAMVARGGKLMVLWVNAGARNQLVARSIAYGAGHPVWSEAVVSTLAEEVPEESRLLTATVDQTVYVLWAVIEGKSGSLHGGWLTKGGTGTGEMSLGAKNILRPMNLGALGVGAADIAVGGVENSLAVLVGGKGREVTCQLFDDRGEATGKAAAVEPKSPQHDAMLAQNIGMILFAAMVVLSVWQWRQRPPALKLPAHTELAPLTLRVAAFLIDVAIPAVVVTLIFGMADYTVLLTAWGGALTAPEELLNTPQLLFTMAFYVLHVMVGELFFRRSIGKAIVGLQVLMLDGKAPTVAAVVLRNLVRIAEILPGVIIFYVLISDTRQRFGDLLAGTVVVSQQAPETPADPDAGEHAERKKEELAGAGRGEKRERLK